MKSLLFSLLFLLLPWSAFAQCDLSVQNIQTLAQAKLDEVYALQNFNLPKPYLKISSKHISSYYADFAGKTITLYPWALRDCYCDQYLDGLTPFVGEVIAHEYTHYLDDKLQLSKKIGQKNSPEKTALLGEHVFDNLLWRTGFVSRQIPAADLASYAKLRKLIENK